MLICANEAEETASKNSAKSMQRTTEIMRMVSFLSTDYPSARFGLFPCAGCVGTYSNPNLGKKFRSAVSGWPCDGLLRLRRWRFFSHLPHLVADALLFPVPPSRAPEVVSPEKDMREDEKPDGLPESDGGQMEDRGHEPVPEPHGSRAEESEEQGNENDRGHSHYRDPCRAGILAPSVVTAVAIFLSCLI
jgi:hypothetical protein